jgi:hypothetical protein
MSASPADEYRSLREAITGRTHWRVALALGGIVAWAAILAVTVAVLPYPIAAVLPLIVLLATFEVVRILHFGAERIGRYLQVFHEEGIGDDGPLAPPAWERIAMRFGPSVPGAAGHPLFVPLFALATAVNFLAVLLPGPVPIELGAMAVPHLALLIWLLRADRAMRAQRDAELARYRELRDTGNTKATKLTKNSGEQF